MSFPYVVRRRLAASAGHAEVGPQARYGRRLWFEVDFNLEEFVLQCLLDLLKDFIDRSATLISAFAPTTAGVLLKTFVAGLRVAWSKAGSVCRGRCSLTMEPSTALGSRSAMTCVGAFQPAFSVT